MSDDDPPVLLAETIRLVIRPCEDVAITGNIIAVRLLREEARRLYRSLYWVLQPDERVIAERTP